ncbi:MAG TPA: prolyl oligopeptidase family serine peptidase [Pyrinomonadaceae bacterium]|nr:prolyl oligopeptidase family serine peptidase [Pyrinomonadaceae bacterium]
MIKQRAEAQWLAFTLTGRAAAFACLLMALSCSAPAAGQGAGARELPEYVGRYTDGEDYVVYLEQSQQGLTVRPALWTATQLLAPSGKDEFVVVDRTSRGAAFQRDEKGRVVAVTIRGMEGEGLKLVRAGQKPLPVELFLAGQGRAAARAYLAKGTSDAARLTELAENVLIRIPTKAGAVVQFLSEIAPRFPDNARLHRLLGYAHVAAGDRAAALKSFRRAYSLEPNDKETISGLARLNALPASSAREANGWTLPFPLSAVFAKPTAAEIKKVEEDWRTRDLRPRDVQEAARGSLDLGRAKATVRIVSHLVHGSRHYGAIIVPAGATPGCCPVLIEAKGVSWNYFPLELEKLHSPRLLADRQARFIYVVPSFRGEVLNFAGVAYQSEGDRTDALDGATDDAIALLNVALQTTPEADANRVCAFGHSRGGTVALLLGIRDSRIRCVVDWAGPTDWFYLMGTEGWTEQELYAEGMRTRAKPSETGGQNIERFLLRAIKGEQGLTEVRHRMLASSPLYFARRLPRAQLHYGLEDTSVPVRNGLRFVAELKRQGVPAARYQTFFYPGQGHDTDRIAAPILTREFLTKVLLRP